VGGVSTDTTLYVTTSVTQLPTSTVHEVGAFLCIPITRYVRQLLAVVVGGQPAEAGGRTRGVVHNNNNNNNNLIIIIMGVILLGLRLP